MSARTKTAETLFRHQGIRVAAFGQDPEPPTPPAFAKGGGEIGGPTKRQIPKDHAYDPKSLKPLIRTMWALSVSLGHVLTAHREFSRLKSVSFSPDGMIGGRGYVMPIKDIRAALHEASEHISSICDTIYDEIQGPHWKPKLGELEKNDDEFMKLLDDAKGYMDDPEGEADEDEKEVEKRPSKTRFMPETEEKGPGSKIPNGGDIGADSQGPNPASHNRPQMQPKQASLKVYSYDRRANSSVNPDELGGPRVDHLDRGEQTGPEGSYNLDEPTQDAWGEGAPRGYDYSSSWENDLSDRAATTPAWGSSGLPSDTKTRTDADDFGIGYGAKGEGSKGYGNPGPSGKGVDGPSSGLPDSPPASAGGTGLETVEQSTSGMGLPTVGAGKLPNDGEAPVARSDYYNGPKGNDFNGPVSQTQLPGDGQGGSYSYDRDLPNAGYKSEQTTEPYVTWDSTTHEMTPDHTYQRGPVEGPYVKQ